MTRRYANQADSPNLTTARGAALYIGALLGPGLLLLPGLAAAEAGPASIVAWLALLGLSGLFAAVFSALGRRFPQAGGVIGYVAAGLGPRAGQAAGWSFLIGVVGGAPIVCLIGAGYVTGLTGGGHTARAAIAAALLLAVLALAAVGLRASTGAQLVLVGLLVTLVTVAVAGSAGSAGIAHWTPFAPHGWPSVGRAATTLMLSFVGWEAVAPLTTRFANPQRQLPPVIAIALAVTTALYLGLAVATIGVLGPGAATSVPLADLLGRAVGSAGPGVAAVAAVILTIGAVNAYVTGAATMARQLLADGAADGGRPARAARAARAVRAARAAPGFLAAIAAAGVLLITLYGLRLASVAALVTVPTALFLAVYLASMVSAARVLHGRARRAAVPAALAVSVMLAYCGWALALPATIALAFGWRLPKGPATVIAGTVTAGTVTAGTATAGTATAGTVPGCPRAYDGGSDGAGSLSAIPRMSGSADGESTAEATSHGFQTLRRSDCAFCGDPIRGECKCTQLRLATITSSCTVTGCPSGSRARRGRASLTRIVHREGSRRSATSAAVKNSSGSGGRGAVVFRSPGLCPTISSVPPFDTPVPIQPKKAALGSAGSCMNCAETRS